MLSIYLCEDDERIRNAERIWLEKQILIENFDMEIVLCTGNPEELLDCIAHDRYERFSGICYGFSGSGF